MANAAVVSIDKFGRIVLPKFARDLLSARQFVVSVKDKRVELEPLDLESQIGSLPRLSMKKFMKEHEAEWE